MSKSASSYPFTASDFDNSEPKWRSLYHSLRKAIRNGQLPASTRLPATRELARDLGIARGTVAQAYDLLLAEGFLRSEVGHGTFVSSDLESGRLKPRSGKAVGLKVRLSRRARALALSPYPLVPAAAPKAIAFAPFLPALSEFPIDIWQRIAISAARQMTVGGMRDGDAQGYRPLREALKDYLRLARGLRCETENIFIFPSTMQALDICLRLLADEGDVVACEDPCYRGARSLFRANGLKLLPIPVDEHGMDISSLTNTTFRVRLTYVTPAHQAPLGSVLSASRRLRMIEWAAKSSSIIFEDDYDGEYRYGGRPVPALQAYDEEGVVVHCGTFSKTLFPALRLAYLIVPDRYIDALSSARSITSRYMGIADQLTLTRFISEGHFPRHLGRMRKLYAERRGALAYYFKKYLDDVARLSPVEAGLQATCEFTLKATEKQILFRLREAKLDVHGVEDYLINARLPPMCVLGFAAFNSAELKRAVERMSRAIETFDP